jgi:peptidoglycan hydrolase-like protein with peptidoglycan-binding domain
MNEMEFLDATSIGESGWLRSPGSVIRTVNPFTQGNLRYAGSLVGHLQLARTIYHGSIDGVSDNGTRRAIRGCEHVHGLPEDGEIHQQLLTTMGLG